MKSWLCLTACLVLLLSGFCSLQAEQAFRLTNVQPGVVQVLTVRETGFVETVDIKPGDQVAKDQILLKLDHERQLQAYLATKLRAESRAGIEIAEGELRDKNANLNETLDRFRRRGVTENQVEQAQAQAQIARGKLAQARMMQEMVKLELALAEKLLENRFVRSPINGIVLDIAKPAGSRAAQGDIAITVANSEELAAEIPVTKDSASAFAVGNSVPIRMAGSDVVRQGRIAAINPMENAKNGEQKIRVVFENMRPTLPLAALSLEALLPPNVRTATPSPPPKPPGSQEKKNG